MQSRLNMVFLCLFCNLMKMECHHGKRRTNRNSKDENAVIGHLDGPKGPKDSRLETRIVNGSLVGSKMSSAGATHTDNKITSYFSPSRSPPIADDAEIEGATVLEGECGKDPELSDAQLSRPLPTSASTIQTKVINGHIGTAQNKPLPNAAPKRTVCTRSQALKELQLQSSTAALSNGVKSSNSSSSNLSSQCSVSIATPSASPEMPTSVSTPTTPTSSTSLVTDDCSSPHTGPPTPHKIQALNEEKLRLDSPLSPTSALSKLKLSLTPKKLKFNDKTTKTRRKLPTQNATRGTLQSKTEKVSKVNNPAQMSNGEAKPTQRNTQMSEFFPIRRSERKPKTTLLQERQKEIEERICSGKEEGLTGVAVQAEMGHKQDRDRIEIPGKKQTLEFPLTVIWLTEVIIHLATQASLDIHTHHTFMVKHFGAKGRGVVTTRKFKKGEFVVEYIGDLIDVREAKERESRYAQDATKGCYNYYFTFQNQQYCIDATAESGYLGRLVNHSRNGNLVTKAVEVNGRPHLILLAKQDLDLGTEILYDYGDRSKEALEHHPWLAS
ncbi:histone-lysine N-methyltransferase Set8-like isoform X2 [Scylla paramamosain]|uniref:histone-lysine N-methyltransferase Set8-like isoform X2 n=1 Tax=Scylla paramamosain TaxID=85552 RepID=UPI00308299D0